MSGYLYLDVLLKLASEADNLLPVYVKGCIEQSLHRIFGEIGGHTTVDVLKFDEKRHRLILRVPEQFYVKLRAALTLIDQFQVCKEFGKDKVIFATKEDHEIPSTIELPETERAPGLILPNGEINWNCPCLGGMATGPCGVEFREAFSCFHYSEAEPKGSDCYDQFATMQECFAKYPTVYNKSGSPDEDDDEESKSAADAANLLASQSNVDTVDQLEETDKNSSAKNDKPSEAASKK